MGISLIIEGTAKNVEVAVRDGIIELLNNNPKGRYIDFDLTDDEEQEAYQYWGRLDRIG